VCMCMCMMCCVCVCVCARARAYTRVMQNILDWKRLEVMLWLPEAVESEWKQSNGFRKRLEAMQSLPEAITHERHGSLLP
jgi:hypothetical protein